MISHALYFVYPKSEQTSQPPSILLLHRTAGHPSRCRAGRPQTIAPGSRSEVRSLLDRGQPPTVGTGRIRLTRDCTARAT